MPDKTINCATCGRKFTWTMGEQKFYRQKGLSRPRHCPRCRKTRQQTADPVSRFILTNMALMGGLVLILGSAAWYFELLPLAMLGPLMWLLLINGLTYRTYGYDKKLGLAATKTRVPENWLHLLAALGGWPGAFLGMLSYRHKTQDTQFRRIYFAIVGVHLLLGGAGLWLTLL